MDVAAAVEYVKSGKGRVAPVYSREISKISQRNLVYSFLISGLQTLMFSQQVLSITRSAKNKYGRTSCTRVLSRGRLKISTQVSTRVRSVVFNQNHAPVCTKFSIILQRSLKGATPGSVCSIIAATCLMRDQGEPNVGTSTARLSSSPSCLYPDTIVLNLVLVTYLFTAMFTMVYRF